MGAERLAAARAALAAAEESVGLANSTLRAASRGEEWERAAGGWSVPAELRALFPRGISPGQTFGTRGSRLASVFLAAIPSAQGAWMACIGVPDMGWAAAAGLGVNLERTITVPRVDTAATSRVLTAAIDGFDVVMIGRGVSVDRATKRALARRALTRETLLIGEGWEERDYLSARFDGAVGMDGGRGHIRALRVEMSSGGRPVHVLLTDTGWMLEGPVLAAVPDAPRAVGARVDVLPGAVGEVDSLREAGVLRRAEASREARAPRRAGASTERGAGLHVVRS